MKRMPLSRLFALPLALTLLLSPAAQALPPDQARELLQDYYIDEVPEDVLDQNTIQAMLEALGDPYTTYFSPEEYGAFTGSMSDTDTVGVGIYSLVTADGPLIQRVYENTPAADAGLQPGDLVTAVDGRSTAGQDAGTVAAWLKGDPGTRVELSYRRDGAEYTAVLTRRAITVPAPIPSCGTATSATSTATPSAARRWPTSSAAWRTPPPELTTGSSISGATAAVR